MNPEAFWFDTLTRKVAVEVDERQLFNVYFCERNQSFELQHGRHSVAGLFVVNQYAEALRSVIQLLNSPSFNWNVWTTSDGSLTARSVAVFDLGPGMQGAAVSFPRKMPYLVLNARSPDLPEMAMRRRQAIVAHELVHLLQFETPTYQYWSSRGRIGEDRDPNWWLHEATALAIETELSPKPAASLPLFWDWATVPEVSAEGPHDPYGTLMAPFLIFLGRRHGWKLLSDLYRVTPNEVASMRGTDILAWTISNVLQEKHNSLQSAVREVGQQSGTPDSHSVGLSKTDADPTSLEAQFLEYCVDAAFLSEGETVLPKALYETVGGRALTDRFESYPVSAAATNAAIDHLACRYFEFLPTTTSDRLSVSITLNRTDDMPVFRAALVTVARNGQRQLTLMTANTNGFTGSAPFRAKECSRAVLIVANCAYGFGWANHQLCRFTIDANINS